MIAGAGGRGLVYEQGALIGLASISQLTVGAQVGSQEYSQLILFQDETTLEGFKQGRFEMSAQTSAIVAAKGAAESVGTPGVYSRSPYRCGA